MSKHQSIPVLNHQKPHSGHKQSQRPIKEPQHSKQHHQNHQNHQNPKTKNYKIFVGCIPGDVTQPDLRLFFSTYGRIQTLKLNFKARNVNSGYCIITCADVETYSRLLAQPVDFHGRKLECRPFMKDSELQVFRRLYNQRRIYIYNVSPKLSDQDIKELFEEKIGGVESAYLIRKNASHSGSSSKRGSRKTGMVFGYVLFKSKGGAERAVLMKSVGLNGSRIKIKKFEDKSQQGHRHTPPGRVGGHGSLGGSAKSNQRAKRSREEHGGHHSHREMEDGPEYKICLNNQPLEFSRSLAEDRQGSASHRPPEAGGLSLGAHRPNQRKFMTEGESQQQQRALQAEMEQGYAFGYNHHQSNQNRDLFLGWGQKPAQGGSPGLLNPAQLQQEDSPGSMFVSEAARKMLFRRASSAEFFQQEAAHEPLEAFVQAQSPREISNSGDPRNHSIHQRSGETHQNTMLGRQVNQLSQRRIPQTRGQHSRQGHLQQPYGSRSPRQQLSRASDEFHVVPVNAPRPQNRSAVLQEAVQRPDNNGRLNGCYSSTSFGIQLKSKEWLEETREEVAKNHPAYNLRWNASYSDKYARIASRMFSREKMSLKDDLSTSLARSEPSFDSSDPQRLAQAQRALLPNFLKTGSKYSDLKSFNSSPNFGGYLF